MQTASHQSTYGCLVGVKLVLEKADAIKPQLLVTDALTWANPSSNPTIACVSQAYTNTLHAPTSYLATAIHLIKSTVASLRHYPRSMHASIHLLLSKIRVNTLLEAQALYNQLMIDAPSYALTVIQKQHGLFFQNLLNRKQQLYAQQFVRPGTPKTT
jgi:hypothetical protein